MKNSSYFYSRFFMKITLWILWVNVKYPEVKRTDSTHSHWLSHGNRSKPIATVHNATQQILPQI